MRHLAGSERRASPNGLFVPQEGYSINWGGRKKKGRVLSNLYKLTLPKPAPKREEVELAEFWEDVDSSQSRVAQRYPYPLHSATPHSSTALPPTVAQCNPIIYRTSKDHPIGHNPPKAGEEMPRRFELVWVPPTACLGLTSGKT